MYKKIFDVSDIKTYVKLTCVALLWGGTFIAGRMISTEIPTNIAALFRFLIASVLLLILVSKIEGKFVKLSFSQHVFTAGMGLTGVFAYNIFFFNALSYMEAGRTALFVSLSPVLTIIAARILFKEKLSIINYLGILIAFLGTLIVVTRGHLFSQFNSSFGLGELMMVGAVTSWVIYTVLCKKLVLLTPLVTTTYSTLWGTLFLFVSSIPNLSEFKNFEISLDIFLSITYLGVFGTVLAFIWYAQGIVRLGASRTVVFNNFVPFFAVLLSFCFLDEKLTGPMVNGGILSFIGVMLTNKKEVRMSRVNASSRHK